jgi:hypothetical protein
MPRGRPRRRELVIDRHRSEAVLASADGADGPWPLLRSTYQDGTGKLRETARPACDQPAATDQAHQGGLLTALCSHQRCLPDLYIFGIPDAEGLVATALRPPGQLSRSVRLASRERELVGSSSHRTGRRGHAAHRDRRREDRAIRGPRTDCPASRSARCPSPSARRCAAPGRRCSRGQRAAKPRWPLIADAAARRARKLTCVPNAISEPGTI